MAKERKKRVILANPDEPRAGDFAFQFYDKAHPTHGDRETVNRLRRELRGLAGEHVTMTFNGKRTDPDTGDRHRFRIRRTFKLENYRSVFGPGSAFASAIHYIRDEHSDEELVIDTFSIEEADDFDEDEEFDE